MNITSIQAVIQVWYIPSKTQEC